MRKILIIYPHFPPSNLVGIHRIRLFANHLPSLGWEPIILTVHEDYYEENQDHNLVKLLPQNLRIEKVKAFRVTKPRLIGDIGMRAFFQLKRKANDILKNEKIDFVLFSIPSFYCALIGRFLKNPNGVKYGVDYQDPWVHFFPGSNKVFSRHWFSTKIAKILEPIAVKKASLICGIADGYYMPVLERNPKLKNVVHGAMPMGGEESDYEFVNKLNIKPYLFSKNNQLKLVYAGALLPKAYAILEKVFESIFNNIDLFNEIEFHFIGTGSIAADANSNTIKPIAEKYNLWQNIVFEYAGRIPYLDVLIHLNIADAIFILGSTEPHYTPSKVYQGVLSAKPIFAILHEQSTAKNIIEKSNSGLVVPINGQELESFNPIFLEKFIAFKSFIKNYDSSLTDKKYFEEFTALSVTKKLVQFLDKI